MDHVHVTLCIKAITFATFEFQVALCHEKWEILENATLLLLGDMEDDQENEHPVRNLVRALDSSRPTRPVFPYEVPAPIWGLPPILGSRRGTHVLANSHLSRTFSAPKRCSRKQTLECSPAPRNTRTKWPCKSFWSMFLVGLVNGICGMSPISYFI